MLEWVGADFASLRAGLERRVIELGLAGRVHFHGSVEPRRAVPADGASAPVRVRLKL